ncbi:hypothetical protein ACVLV4_000426 [Rathayibacter agropyri]
MTKCARQYEDEYQLSWKVPGRESGVTLEQFYSGVNVARRGFQPESLHMTTVTDTRGVQKTFLTASRPSVLAHIYKHGEWIEKRKHLEWEGDCLKASIQPNHLYLFEDFSWNDEYNAGNNVQWITKRHLSEDFTMFPRDVLIQLTEGQARRILSGGEVPIHEKPYSLDAQGFKPHPITYIGGPKRQKADEDPTQPTLFDVI